MLALLGCFFAHLSYSLRTARLASSFFMLVGDLFAMQAIQVFRADPEWRREVLRLSQAHPDKKGLMTGKSASSAAGCYSALPPAFLHADLNFHRALPCSPLALA
jgi:hypothetical protein